MPGEQGKVIITSHKPELMSLFKEYCTFESDIEASDLRRFELRFEFIWPYANAQAAFVLYGSGGGPLWRLTEQENYEPTKGIDGLDPDDNNISTTSYGLEGVPARVWITEPGSPSSTFLKARGGRGAKEVITLGPRNSRIHTITAGTDGYDRTDRDDDTRQTGAMANDGAHGLAGRIPTTEQAEFSPSLVSQSANGGNGEKLVRTVSIVKGSTVRVNWGARYYDEFDDRLGRVWEERQRGFVSITPQ